MPGQGKIREWVLFAKSVDSGMSLSMFALFLLKMNLVSFSLGVLCFLGCVLLIVLCVLSVVFVFSVLCV